MATATQIARLRRDVGATETSLPDADITDLYTEAAETYATSGASQEAYVRVLAIRGLLASSAKLVTYSADGVSESASHVFEHLTKLLTFWQAELDAAVLASSDSSGSVRFGAPKRMPRQDSTRVREYPGS